MRCTMCHQKDPHFLSPLSPSDPLVYALPPIDPLSSVTQRPQISDLSPKDPQFLILSPHGKSSGHPKTHHFNYMAQTLISHNWSQDLKGFITHIFLHSHWKTPLSLICHQKTPIFLVFGCSCPRKTSMSEVLGGTCTSLWCDTIYECPLRVGLLSWFFFLSFTPHLPSSVRRQGFPASVCCFDWGFLQDG